MAAAALAVAAGACSPTNPFDPATPSSLQERAALRGRVVLKATKDEVADSALRAFLAQVGVSLRDPAGEEVQENGAVAVHALTDVDADARPDSGGAFRFDDLVPGTYEISVDLGGASGLFAPAAVGGVAVLAGDDHDVGTLTLPFVAGNQQGGGPGSIDGQVTLQDGGDAERTITLFRKTESGVAQVASLVSPDGTFRFSSLALDNYALVATAPNHTAHYQLDVDLTQSQSQSFTAAGSLELFPVSSVLLPVDSAQVFVDEGVAYVNADAVPLAVLAAGGINKMRLSTSPDFVDDAGADVPFVPFSASASVALPTDREGSIPIFAQFRADSSAFSFTSESFSTDVVRDRSPPAVLDGTVAGLPLDGAGRALARDGALTLDIDAQDIVSAVDGVAVVVSDTEPLSFASVDDVTSQGGLVRLTRAVNVATDGPTSIWIAVRDRARNLSPAFEVPILVDRTAPLSGASLFVDNAVSGVLSTRLAALRIDPVDASDDAPLGLEIEAITGAGQRSLTGLVPFAATITVDLPPDLADDGSEVTFQAIATDRVGNQTTLSSQQVQLSLRGAVTGTVALEGVPLITPTNVGAVVRALDSSGAQVATATTADDGSFTLTNLPEGAGYSLDVVRAGYAGQVFGPLAVPALAAGDPAVSVAPIRLALARGSLTGLFRLQDHANEAANNAGIIVALHLHGSNRTFDDVTQTGSDGRYTFRDVPSTTPAESYALDASAAQFANADTDTPVVADAVTRVANDTPLILGRVSGDFDVCQAAGTCTAGQFFNVDTVAVHLRSTLAVADIRVVARAAADPPLLDDDVDPPFAPFDPINQTPVSLPAVEGALAVYVQTRDELGNVQPVLTGNIVRDVTPPSLIAVARVPSSSALDPRFTNVPFVDVDVAADAGAGVVAPLDLARAAVTDAPPADGSIPAGAIVCATASSCHVLLPGAGTGTVVEKVHNVFAWACDAAGNCASPGSTFVIFDKTPPRAANGADFRVVTSGTSAGRGLVTSTSTRLVLSAGTAASTAGTTVQDENGAGLADAVAFRAALSSATLASTTLRRIDPTPSPGEINIAVDGPALPDLDGNYTVVAQLVDAAGNASLAEPPAFSENIALDRAAPTGTIDVTPTITNVTTVPAVLSYSADTVGVAFSGIDLDCRATTYAPATGSPQSISVAILAGDGGKIVNACFIDAAGNVSKAFDVVTLDQTPPLASLAFAGGATVTFSPTVTLTVTAPADATAIALAEGTTINCATGSFQPLAAPTITLTSGASPQDGQRAVIGCVRDVAGNTTVTAPVSILLDRFPPTGSVAIDAGAAVTNDRRFALTFTASSDVTQMAIATADFVCDSPAVTYEAFSSVQLIDIPPAVPDGAVTVFACLKESAGRTVKVTDAINLDTTAPNASIVINGDAATTSLRDVTISATFDAEVNGMALSQVPFDCRTAPYVTPAVSTPLTLQTTGGFATVFACFKDAAFNTRAANDTIFVEQAANGSLVVAINGGAASSNNRNVTVSLLAPSDASQMKVAEAQTLDCADPAGYETFASTKALSLSGGTAPAEGVKTVSACVKTSSNQTFFATDTILLDTFTPDGTVTVNGGAAQTNNALVTVVVVPDASSSDVTDIALSSTVGSCGTFQPFTSTLSFTLGGLDGVKTVDACFRDAAGNTRERQATIALDRLPPTGVSLTLPSFSTTTTTTATLAASGAAQVAVAEGALDCTTTVLYQTFATSLPVSLTAIDGARSVTACFKDGAGNISTASAVTVLDTVGPSAADSSVVINGGATFATSPALSVAVTAPSDVTLMSVSTTDPGSCAGAATPFTTPVAVNISPATDGTKTVFVCLKDGAGHSAKFSDAIILDGTAPAPTSVQIEGGAVATNNKTVQVTINGAPADTAQMTVADGDIANCSTATYVPFVGAFSRTLPAGDGSKRVSVCLRDTAGNTQATETSANIVLDTAGPSLPANAVALVSHAAGDGAGFTIAGVVDLTLNFTPGAGEELEVKHGEGALDCSSGAYAALPGASPLAVPSIALSAGDGTKTYSACFRDAAGNTTLASSTLVRDGTAPATTSIVCTDCTGDGTTLFRAAATANLAVTSDEAGSGLASARVSVDAAAEIAATLTNGAITVSLPSDATHTVDVRLVDRAGNISATAKRITIVRDTTIPVLPTQTSFLLNGANSGGFTNNTSLAVAVNGAPSDVVSMALAETTIDCTTASYVPFSPATTFVTTSGQGLKTVKLCMQDRAGNKSSSVAATQSASITLDSVPPSLPALAVDIQDGGDGLLTSGAAVGVKLTWTLSGDVVALKLGEGAIDCTTGPYTAVTGNPTTTNTLALTFAAGDGQKTASACFKDVAGNTVVASDTSTLDSTPPTGTVLVAGGAAKTRLFPSVPVALTAASDVVQMALLDTTAATLTCATASYVAFASSANVTLTNNTNQTKTVSACFKDAAGNTTAVPAVDTIVLDTAVPSATLTLTGTVRDAGTSTTLTRLTTVTADIIGESADAVDMMVSTDSGFAGEVFEPLVPGAFPVTLLPGDGTAVVFLKVRDDAGNESVPISANITVDTTPPSAPTVLLANGNAFTTTTTVAIALSAQTLGAQDGTLQVRVSANDPDFLDGGAENFANLPGPASVTVPAGDGNKTAFAIFRDAAGNETAAVNDGITLDQTAPVLGGAPPALVIQKNAGGFTNSLAALVSFNVSGATQMRVACDGVLDGETFTAFAPTLNCLLPTGDGRKVISAEFKDDAGNTTAVASDSLFLDTKAPTAPIVSSQSAVVTAPTFSVNLGFLGDDANVTGASPLKAFIYQIRGGNIADFSDCGTSLPALDAPQIAGCTGPPFNFTLAQNQENRLSVRIRDRGGNVSAADTVLVVNDTIAPGIARHQNSDGTFTPLQAADDLDAGDGYAIISWEPPADVDVAGYRVFYGFVGSTNKADYNGAFANQGLSPIDVGSPCTTKAGANDCQFQLTGLPNGQPIFITVAAYDRTTIPGPNEGDIVGNLSVIPNRIVPKHLSQISPATLGSANAFVRGIAVRDGLAYVTSGSRANPGRLSVVDISNPAAPVVIGTGKSAGVPVNLTGGFQIYLQGDFAYVADGVNGLRTFQLRNDTFDPDLRDTDAIDQVATPDNHAVAIAGQGDLIFVGSTALSGGTNGFVRKFTIAPGSCGGTSGPANPCLVDTFGGQTISIAAQGNLVFPINTSNNLRLFDISTTPATALALFNIGTNARGVQMSGNFLYLSGFFTAQAVNIANPNAPVVLSGAPAIRILGQSSVLSGGHLYIDTGGKIDIVETFPTNSTVSMDVAGLYNSVFGHGEESFTGGNTPSPGMLAVDGNFLYQATGSGGLEILRLTAVRGLEEEGVFLSTFGSDATMVGTSVVTSHGNTGIEAVHANVAAPSVYATSSFQANGLDSDGDLIVATGDSLGTLRGRRLIQNASFLNTATFTATLPFTTIRPKIHWPSAFVAGSTAGSNAISNTLKAVELRGFTQTSSVGYTAGDFNGQLTPTHLAYYRDRVYLTNSVGGAGTGQLEIMNVSNPSSLTRVGAFNDGTGVIYNDIAITGRRAFVAAGTGFKVLDLANPDAPAVIGGMSTLSFTPRQLAVSGPFVYVAGLGGLAIIDASNIASPVVVAAETSNALDPVKIIPAGNLVFVLNNNSEMQILRER